MNDWNQYRGDPHRSGRRRTLDPPDRPDTIWDVEIGRSVTEPPVLDRDTVFVGANEESLYAFDRHTGRRRWVFDAPTRIDSSPVCSAEFLYVTGSDGTLFALEAETGAIRWQEPVAGAVESPPTLSGTTLVVGHSDGVTALDADTGTELWHHETDAETVGAPAMASGHRFGFERIYIGTAEAELLALETETGDHVWTAPMNGAVVGGPTIVPGTDTDTNTTTTKPIGETNDMATGNRLYVADDEGLLLALNPDTGQTWFTYQITDSFTTAPTVVNDSIFVAASDGYLHVTDTTFGKRKLRGWLFSKKGLNLDGVATAPPALVGDCLCLGDSSGSLYGIDVSDPDYGWHYPLEAGVSSGPAVAADALYVGTDDGRLCCLSWRDDASSWY